MAREDGPNPHGTHRKSACPQPPPGESATNEDSTAAVAPDLLIAALGADPLLRERNVDVCALARQLRSHGLAAGITDARWLDCLAYALGELHETAIDGTTAPGRLLFAILQRVGAPRQLELALKSKADRAKPRSVQPDARARSRFSAAPFDTAEYVAHEDEQSARVDREMAERRAESEIALAISESE